MKNQYAIPLAVLALLTGAFGCLAEQGEKCRIDSECEPGLVCGLQNTCQTFQQVYQYFHPPKPDVVFSDTDGGGQPDAPDIDTPPPDEGAADNGTPIDDAGPDGGGCPGPTEFFGPHDPPCPEPPEKRVVTGMTIAAEGHGAAGLAFVANGMLEEYFLQDKIYFEMWVDGTFEQGCSWQLGWWRRAEDRNADCSLIYTDIFPFEIPDLVVVKIYEAVVDPDTLVLTGYLDEQEMIDSMDPSMHEAADQMIELDLDTDGDQVPDKATIILTLSF